jgi:hypothetical protein
MAMENQPPKPSISFSYPTPKHLLNSPISRDSPRGARGETMNPFEFQKNLKFLCPDELVALTRDQSDFTSRSREHWVALAFALASELERHIPFMPELHVTAYAVARERLQQKLSGIAPLDGLAAANAAPAIEDLAKAYLRPDALARADQLDRRLQARQDAEMADAARDWSVPG